MSVLSVGRKVLEPIKHNWESESWEISTGPYLMYGLLEDFSNTDEVVKFTTWLLL